jgi:putative aldouronate transport system substrate-binding protein
MSNSTFNRRQLLLGGAGLAALGLTAAACGGGDDETSGGGSTTSAGSQPTGDAGAGSTGGGSAGSGGASPSGSASGAASGPLPPARVPFTGVTPDLPAGDHGIPAGFYHYPDNPPTFVKHSLGSGDEIKFLLQQGDAPAAPVNNNKWWQNLNTALNTKLDINSIESASYQQKFQVSIAGGDLPDVVQVVSIADMPNVLDKYFVDLTDYLGGDKIKAYPGLASIPTATWQIPELNGRLWGITQPRPSAGVVASTRGDLLKGFGVSTSSPELSSGQDFLDLCKELTDTKRNRYAIGEQPNSWVLNAVLEMMGAPNLWQEEGGKFTSINESDQMKDALTQVAAMWKAGYIHPDSFATPGSNYVWWSGGITSIYFQAFTGWSSYAILNPSWDIGVLTAPKWDGGGIADKILGVAGYGAYVAIKKAKDDRVKEILNVLDYIASPFGTKEFLDVNFGAEGVDYTLDGADPVATKTGASDHMYHIQYCGAQARVNLYVPGNQDLVKAQHDYLSKVLPTGVSDPTWGLYSPTLSSKGATADKTLLDFKGDIIQGRKSISDYDGALKAWVSAAGDDERKEYEEAYAKAHGGS